MKIKQLRLTFSDDNLFPHVSSLSVERDQQSFLQKAMTGTYLNVPGPLTTLFCHTLKQSRGMAQEGYSYHLLMPPLSSALKVNGITYLKIPLGSNFYYSGSRFC